MSSGLQTTIDRANELAREFYQGMGYAVPEGYRFDKAKHPQEQLCWTLVVLAYEHIDGIELGEVLSELEDD